IIITLVVTFLLLYDKEKYRAFFFQVLKMEDRGERHEVLNQIAKVSQQYLLGRIISMSILFVLYYIALVAIGVENALLLAGAAAIVNIICSTTSHWWPSVWKMLCSWQVLLLSSTSSLMSGR